MPGIPTKFVIAELVLERLKADKKLPSELKNDANLTFFYLGAMGASFGDLMPARPDIGGVPPNSNYFQAWMPILQVLSGTPGTPGVYQNLKQLRLTLVKLKFLIDNAVNGDATAKEASKFALLLMIDELNALQGLIKTLTTSVNSIAAIRVNVGTVITAGGPTQKTAPSSSWQIRDTLHQSKTGAFLATLHKTATNNQQKAYALGASIGYSAALCGNPYINTIVGGPYRNHWWRHRWISNYVDTWVYGFYKQGGANSVLIDPGNIGVPNPFYTNWPNLCEANLQKRIELPGINQDDLFNNIANSQPVSPILPQSFVDYWINAFKVTYGNDAGGRVSTAGVQSAYSLTWLTLWIETSGAIFPCIPSDQVTYPEDCGTRPDWVAVDGAVAVGDAPAANPPQPSMDTDPSLAEVVSGIILAIVAVEAWIAIGLLAGVEALVGAAVLIADGLTDPDWDKLRCHIGWSLAYEQNFTNGLHDMLTWAGFLFPYTETLAHDDIVYAGSQRTLIQPLDAALLTVRSRLTGTNYPASRWRANASNWNIFPTEPLENNPVVAYPRDATWPFHFIDGLQPTNPPPRPPNSPPGPRVGVPQQVNPLFAKPGRPALVRDQLEFTLRRQQLNFPSVAVSFFGNAVDVSLELLLNVTPQEFIDMDLDFLDWDIDGDPGFEFPTWRLQKAGDPRTASIPEP